ncbi:MAG: hypothetical protein K1X78_28205 [Verrucomicrobiaceae bacterium]|nr:hypothetical protein [Verrucomicrobiaceae bacterium]
MFHRFDIHTRIVQRSGITFYGARDKLLGREVWLWRLMEFGDAQPPPAAQLDAAKAPLRALQHPALVKLHDIEADPDGLVALLEPAAGESLDALMARGPADVAVFQDIAQSCLRALAAAAAAGVPHGALEPGLIFCARAGDGTMKATVAGTGIAAFVMRMQGLEHPCSESLDVWMLGGVLHALLIGDVAAEGGVAKVPHEVRPEVPEAISLWVMLLLADDPAVRPQTAAAALELLQQAVAPPAAADKPAESQVSEVPVPPVHWPAGFDPHLHQPPTWHYPPVALWHVPPQQWAEPYDPAQAAQHPQMWHQLPWQQWHAPVQHDPYQIQYLQHQQQIIAQQLAAAQAAAAQASGTEYAAPLQAQTYAMPVEPVAGPPVVSPPAGPSQLVAVPVAVPVAQTAAPPSPPVPSASKTQPLAANAAIPKARLPAPSKRTATGEGSQSAATTTSQATPKKDPRRFIGPAISLAVTLLVIWFFRGFFSAFLNLDALRGVFGRP